MTVLGTQLHTLADLTARIDPDGKVAVIGEWLSQTNETLEDQLWQEGNLPTGERTTVRVGLPTVTARGLNQGVDPSKSRVAQVDEGAAMFEGQSDIDRQAAMMSGAPDNYRLTEATSFYQALSNAQSQTLFYGNAAFSPKEYTGLAPRYNSLSGSTKDQIIDGGGTGTDNSSIWLIVWSPMGVKGIYPKGSKAGITHINVTGNTGTADDGYEVGHYVNDADGKRFLAVSDNFIWKVGLSVKDPRYAVRIPNIDKSLLLPNYSTGAQIEMLMVQALERVEGLNMPGTKAAWYMPRNIRAMFRQQLVNNANNSNFSYETVGGKRVLMMGEVPVRRVDALKADEARVV
ncbi:hypothetical protein CVO77_00255 [Sphingopyxis lindanitolerans]|uniref:Phage capsid protein n=1 Tax=Sphingopyxis lindanitolerans TaxID=2054227 RepID=A0A2S8BAP6_9SPHN|nr:hypothetical protein [Sphingopyxis lindanitolerans]PQM29406.1 hypothetical protein CVO77_00255 [Sphingopyxis lindanitolerans]